MFRLEYRHSGNNHFINVHKEVLPKLKLTEGPALARITIKIGDAELRKR